MLPPTSESSVFWSNTLNSLLAAACQGEMKVLTSDLQGRMCGIWSYPNKDFSWMLKQAVFLTVNYFDAVFVSWEFKVETLVRWMRPPDPSKFEFAWSHILHTALFPFGKVTLHRHGLKKPTFVLIHKWDPKQDSLASSGFWDISH